MPATHRLRLALALSVMAPLALTGCASTKDDYQTASSMEIIDPLEGFNRAVYGLNEAADILFIGPASHIYRDATPEPVQSVVRNFVRNLEMPVIAINKLLQGNLDGFGTALGRFLVNSTVGLAGLADIATGAGLPYEDTDFGVTLASWGADPVMYVMLPLLGPSTLRDGVGRGVDYLMDPVRIAADNQDLDTELFAANTLRLLDTRASLDAAIRDTRSNAIDSYAALRSFYVQRRAAEIKDQLGPGIR